MQTDRFVKAKSHFLQFYKQAYNKSKLGYTMHIHNDNHNYGEIEDTG